MENNITRAAVGNQQKNNTLVAALSKLNAKRKKIVASLTAMVMMSVMSAVTAFADNEGGVDGEAAFNEVVGFFATWLGSSAGSFCRSNCIRCVCA